MRRERLPGLQGADGIDLGDVHDGAHGLQRRAAALPYLGGGKRAISETPKAPEAQNSPMHNGSFQTKGGKCPISAFFG